MKKIMLLVDIGGGVDEGEGAYYDVKRGDIIEVSDMAAERYVKAGMAQLDLKSPPGRAFATAMAKHNPETHRKQGEKMKIKLLTDMRGGWSAGAGLQYRDTLRGAVVEASAEEGARLVRLGYATADLSLTGDDLPRPFGTAEWGGNPNAGRSPYYGKLQGGWG
jgi:orotidine-5'-phosphate decarboxylase